MPAPYDPTQYAMRYDWMQPGNDINSIFDAFRPQPLTARDFPAGSQQLGGGRWMLPGGKAAPPDRRGYGPGGWADVAQNVWAMKQGVQPSAQWMQNFGNRLPQSMRGPQPGSQRPAQVDWQNIPASAWDPNLLRQHQGNAPMPNQPGGMMVNGIPTMDELLASGPVAGHIRAPSRGRGRGFGY